MVIDASAVLAVLKEEPDKVIYAKALSRRVAKHMSPVNWYEGAVRLESTGDFNLYEQFLAKADIEIVPVDEATMRLAHRAWLQYGKGRSPAKLNLGDCFAYALAAKLNEPLLFKGNDFSKTDIPQAL